MKLGQTRGEDGPKLNQIRTKGFSEIEAKFERTYVAIPKLDQFLAKYERSWKELRGKLDRNLAAVIPRSEQSCVEVRAKLSRSSSQVVLKFERGCSEVRAKLSQSSSELRAKFFCFFLIFFYLQSSLRSGNVFSVLTVHT